MPPRKSKREREESRSPPRRKSVRLANLSSEHAEDSRRVRQYSSLSTQPEPPETWESLKSAAKARIDSYTPGGRASEHLLNSTLHAFLDWLPDGGKESVARDVKTAETDEDLWAVFHNLITGLLCPMKSESRWPSLTPSPHPKRNDNAEIIASTIDQPEPRDPDFRELCLQRDSSKCVVTGNMDLKKWKQLGSPDDIDHGDLEAAHIIPYAYASWNEAKGPGTAPHIWEVLYRCFPALRHWGLNVENINIISNGITLLDYIHKQFGRFRLSFKATETPNVYTLKLYPSLPSWLKSLVQNDLMIQFQQAEGSEELGLPNPAFLECHYRVAEILNASGMAEYIDDKFREWEELKGVASLRQDGTTDVARILHSALWEHVKA